MTGTLILYPKDKPLIIVGGVEESVAEEIKAQCGHDHCKCNIEDRIVDFGQIEYVSWRQGKVNFEYGF